MDSDRKAAEVGVKAAGLTGCDCVAPAAQETSSCSQPLLRTPKTGFNTRCRTPRLDSRDEKDPRWQNDCRKLSARLLQDLLTRAPWREATPLGDVSIGGARIVGNVDLSDASLTRAILISGSRIEGKIDLTRARTDSLIDDSLMSGEFLADSLHSESDLNLLAPFSRTR